MAASNASSAENGTASSTVSTDNNCSAKLVFLVIFMVIGLCGNVVLIITLGCNKKQRKSALQLFSLNLAFVNCLDCFFNMSFALASATGSVSWSSEDFLCRLNSFFMNLIWIETILGLMFMTLDRMMATRHSDKYEQFQSMPRFIIMLIYTWVHSISFSAPLLAGAIDVDVYKNVQVCMMANNVSIIYTLIMALVCFLIPIIVSLIFFTLAIKVSCSEHSIHAIRSQNQYSKEVEEPKLLKELNGAKYTGILLFLWIIMEVPYIGAQLIRMFRYSDDLNINSSFQIPNSYSVDVSLVWIRFAFVLVLPILALLWKKELWQLFKNIILCRKSNLIVDLELKVENPPSREKLDLKYSDDKKQVKEEKMKEAFVHNSGFQVPVLFATSRGVHIQTGSDEESDYDEIKIRGKKCDVLGSQGNLQGYEYETSDYDSSNEMDPFSVSHPISARKSGDVHPSLQKRSSSHPEVGKSNNKVGKPASVTATSAADSGLDMSNNNSSTKDTSSSHQTLEKENVPLAEKENGEGHDTEMSPQQPDSEITSESIPKQSDETINNQEILPKEILKLHNNESNDEKDVKNCSNTDSLNLKRPNKLEPIQSPLKTKNNFQGEPPSVLEKGNEMSQVAGRHQLYVKLPSLGSESKESQESARDESQEVMTPSGCKLIDVPEDFQMCQKETE